MAMARKYTCSGEECSVPLARSNDRPTDRAADFAKASIVALELFIFVAVLIGGHYIYPI
jgi:hypothetical protein